MMPSEVFFSVSFSVAMHSFSRGSPVRSPVVFSAWMQVEEEETVQLEGEETVQWEEEETVQLEGEETAQVEDEAVQLEGEETVQLEGEETVQVEEEETAQVEEEETVQDRALHDAPPLHDAPLLRKGRGARAVYACLPRTFRVDTAFASNEAAAAQLWLFNDLFLEAATGRWRLV
ncbi:unnamed protein product [Gadus morhua 'NCC']